MNRIVAVAVIFSLSLIGALGCEDFDGWRWNGDEHSGQFEVKINGEWETLIPVVLAFQGPHDDYWSYFWDYPDTPQGVLWKEDLEDCEYLGKSCWWWMQSYYLENYSNQIYNEGYTLFKPSNFQEDGKPGYDSFINRENRNLIDEMLEWYAENGYTIIRVPINSNLISNPKSTDPYEPELYDDYLDNVVDFLERARKYNISVILWFNVPPAYAFKPILDTWTPFTDNFWVNTKYYGVPNIKYVQQYYLPTLPPDFVRQVWGRFIAKCVYEINYRSDDHWASNLFGIEILTESYLHPHCIYSVDEELLVSASNEEQLDDYVHFCDETPNDPQFASVDLIRGIENDSNPDNPSAPHYWQQMLALRNDKCPDCENPFIGNSLHCDPDRIEYIPGHIWIGAHHFSLSNLNLTGEYKWGYQGLSIGCGGGMRDPILELDKYSCVEQLNMHADEHDLSDDLRRPIFLSETSPMRVEVIMKDPWYGFTSHFIALGQAITDNYPDLVGLIHNAIDPLGDFGSWLPEAPDEKYLYLWLAQDLEEARNNSMWVTQWGLCDAGSRLTGGFDGFGYWEFSRHFETMYHKLEYAHWIATLSGYDYINRVGGWDLYNHPMFSEVPTSLIYGGVDCDMESLDFDCSGYGGDPDEDGICEDFDNCPDSLGPPPPPEDPTGRPWDDNPNWNPGQLDSDADGLGDRCDDEFEEGCGSVIQP